MLKKPKRESVCRFCRIFQKYHIRHKLFKGLSSTTEWSRPQILSPTFCRRVSIATHELVHDGPCGTPVPPQSQNRRRGPKGRSHPQQTFCRRDEEWLSNEKRIERRAVNVCVSEISGRTAIVVSRVVAGRTT